MVNHNRFGRATETVRRGSGSFFQPPRPAADFAPWIKRQPGPAGRAGQGAIIVFPHAGAAASSYRTLATALAAGGDTFVVQYPRRAERLNHPAPQTIHDLAHELFQAGPWHRARRYGCSGTAWAPWSPSNSPASLSSIGSPCTSCGSLPDRCRRRSPRYPNCPPAPANYSPIWPAWAAPTRACWPMRSSLN